jgi:uncharacterized protein YndB with AHSA1/START domain
MNMPPQPMTHGETPARVVRTTIEIAAPPKRVFEALTDARELATWWAGDDARVLECDADLRPGGSWHVRIIDGDGAERAFDGEYRVVDPPHRLEQTWRASDDGDASIVRYDLEPLEVEGGTGTRLTVTHTATFAMSMSALASYVSEAPSVVGRYVIEPASFSSPHRVAWAGRILR